MAKTILVVDDNDPVRSVISEMLRGEGYLVQSASNWAQALEIIRRAEPDAIVLDMRLPDTAGVEAIASMRRDRCRSKIVAISGLASLLEAATRAGAHEVLLKPMGPDELVASIGRALVKGASA